MWAPPVLPCGVDASPCQLSPGPALTIILCVARRSLTAKEEEIAKLRKAYDKSERDIKALQVRHDAPCPHAVALRA